MYLRSMKISNSVLQEIRTNLNKSGVDLDIYDNVTIELSEARETVIIARPHGFSEPDIFVQGESGNFYKMQLNAQDVTIEISRQNKMEKEAGAKPCDINQVISTLDPHE